MESSPLLGRLGWVWNDSQSRATDGRFPVREQYIRDAERRGLAARRPDFRSGWRESAGGGGTQVPAASSNPGFSALLECFQVDAAAFEDQGIGSGASRSGLSNRWLPVDPRTVPGVWGPPSQFGDHHRKRIRLVPDGPAHEGNGCPPERGGVGIQNRSECRRRRPGRESRPTAGCPPKGSGTGRRGAASSAQVGSSARRPLHPPIQVK